MASQAVTDSRDNAVGRLEPELASLVRRLEMNHRKRGYPMERAQYLLLAQIEDGEKSSGEIAEALGLDHSTVVRQVAAVERLGFAERRPNPRDRRSVLVGVTRLGAASLEKMRVERRARLTVILAEWSEEERESFGAMLKRFNASLVANERREVGKAAE
jgi:DNA-binding MarR family transcriptional regulator